VPKSYGTWPSPFSAALVAAQGMRLGSVVADGDDIYWLEGRPDEGGRHVLVRRSRDGGTTELTPPAFNVRTRVHEYGGGAFVIGGGLICFSNFADQRLYRMEADHPDCVPLTPPGPWFYADGVVDHQRRRLICVREDHTNRDREPVNTLVAIPLTGDASAGHVLASGYDFYSTPRVSPDGTMLTWLAWMHPQMPWDGTELWAAAFGPGGDLEGPVRIAGGPGESVYQPGWSPDGTLYFVSDRDAWWRLYRASIERGGAHRIGPTEPVIRNPPADAEFGRPQWVFGTSTWACVSPGRLVVSYTRAGRWRLATVDTTRGTLQDVPTHLEPGEWLAASGGRAVLVAASNTTADAVVRIELDTGEAAVLRSASSLSLDAEDISVAEPMTFAGNGGTPVHAFYYPPHSSTCTAPPGEVPPLIALSHGGPTTASRATLDLRVQFWTSRGFAVVDVNYSGSSGFGRAYRERLNGQWGVADVADIVGAVRHLIATGKADPDRLIIRGGSAGGYTTLAALTFHPGVFKAGASYYGVSDIEILARDTHKFESRYLDTLVGPYPAARETYRERSPIHFAHKVCCPVILFQGLEDRVVPPNQSDMMAEAVRRNGWPVACLTFEGEQHGFRRSETVVQCLEAELAFYGEVFGFVPADVPEPAGMDTTSQGAPPPDIPTEPLAG
jgi:dipeptidyl aminopeptidase/acylaminoacyl peptidase